MTSVLLLRSSPGVGGVERQLLDHCRRLQAEGWETRLVCLYRGRGEHPLTVAASSFGLTTVVIPDPSPFSLRPWRELQRLIAAWQPLLLHTCDYRSDVLARLAAPRLPLLAESHGHTQAGASMAVWNRLDLWALRRSQAVAAVSTAWETALAAAGISQQRLTVIENSRAILPYDPSPPATLPSPGPHFLFAGRLAPDKGLDILLRVWPPIRSSWPDAQLWVLGASVPSTRYRRQLGRLLDQPGVHSLGFQPNIRPWLTAVDVVLAPSRREAWGMTVFEALCAGTPVVTTRVGGLPTLCRHAPHALLIPPETPAAIVDGLKLALAPSFPRGTVVGDLFCAQSRFDPVIRYQRLTALYDTLLRCM